MIKAIFKDKEIRIFFIVAMLIGIAMSFIVSPWQIPDEQTHLYYIGKGALCVEDFDAKLQDSLGMDKRRVEWDPTQKTDWNQFVTALTKAPDYEISEMMPQGLTHYAVWYVPAIIGMELAVLLQLPTLWVFQLGELFSLLFYAFVCSAALKVCPIKKPVMALFMLAPMMMQAGSSYSYDALAIPLLNWVICYVLHLRFEKEDITLKDMLLLILPWAWMSFIKIPYAVVVLLGLMLPLEKFHVRLGKKLEINEAFIRKYRWIALAVVLVIGALGIYIAWDNVFIQVLYGVVTEFGRIAYLLGYTLLIFWKHLLQSSVGNFGWLNAPVSLNFAILFYVVIFVIAILGKDSSKKQLKKWDRGVIWVTFLVMTLLTCFSMVHHTICNTYFWGDPFATYDIREYLYMIPYIGGLQGRYFLPFMSLFFLGFGSTEKMNGKATKIAMGVFLAITYIYVFYILLHRFWIG